MISKLRATRGGGFDLAQPSQDRVVAMVEQFGIYQPIDYSKVNEAQLDQNILAATKKYTEFKGQSYSVPHVFGTSGLIVNKKFAPDAKFSSAVLPIFTQGVWVLPTSFCVCLH